MTDRAYLSRVPRLPYLVGSRFTLTSHNPPYPTRPLSSQENKAKKEELKNQGLAAHAEWQTVSPLERCFKTPPKGGSLGDIKVEVEITKRLRVAKYRRSQIAVVKILSTSVDHTNPLHSATTAVAKIYDPLYFSHDEDNVDPFSATDRSYAIEAAAYKRLRKLQGDLIPTYYGSYSLDLDLDLQSPAGKSTRTVRLILMEYIPTLSMDKLKPEDFSVAEQQGIMKCIFEGESKIYAYDIFLLDLHPRNVLLALDGRQGVERTVFLDFEHCWLHRCWDNPAIESIFLPGRYITPYLRWQRRDRVSSFEPWVKWGFIDWLKHEYVAAKDSITHEMRVTFLPAWAEYNSGLENIEEDLEVLDDLMRKGEEQSSMKSTYAFWKPA